MKLYDQIIEETMEMARNAGARPLPFDLEKPWKDLGESEFFMARDAAFELGGSRLPSVNYTCVSAERGPMQDEILLAGPDLAEIQQDVSFARIVILSVKDLGKGEDAYHAIQEMEFARYHVFPEGYMARVSSQSKEEIVRVRKAAIKKGISFAGVGADYIQKYKSISQVKAVRVLFLADCNETIQKLKPYAKKVEDITKTLTHIFDGLATDCGTCGFKKICDEVEGIREMHFGKNKQRGTEK